MTGPAEDDRAAVDRAFAELVAGYHLTADRPAVEPAVEPAGERHTDTAASDTGSGRTGEPGTSGDVDPHWADQHPLFSLPPARERPPVEPPQPERVEHYVPEPMPPLSRPAAPVLLAWLGIGWAALVVLAGAFGAHLPTWVGWVAVVGFLTSFGVLVSRLPRHRPPDSGDGAVL